MGFAHRNVLEGSRLNERDENSCEKVLFSINTRPLPNRLSGSIVDTNNPNPSFYRRWLGSRRFRLSSTTIWLFTTEQPKENSCI